MQWHYFSGQSFKHQDICNGQVHNHFREKSDEVLVVSMCFCTLRVSLLEYRYSKDNSEKLVFHIENTGPSSEFTF